MGLFDSQGFYESFTPPPYTAERSALNPLIISQLNQAASGKPTVADWQNRSAGLRAVEQQHKDASRFAGMDFGARGLGESGWQGQRQGQLLGQRAGAQADVFNQFFQNILARQMEATGMQSDYLAGARAGSGTITQRG